MLPARAILIASHGTEGGRAAEATALSLIEGGGRLHHLVVVPEFWKGMLGDDWLNNAATHIRFGRYVENTIAREIDTAAARLEAAARECGLDYAREIRVGRPGECLLAAAKKGRFDLVVIGSPRPKGKRGLRSRLPVEDLVKGLKAPLIVVPHPGR
ncbi:MAG: universal stress protein [Alphaproteobacteria bacterium]|nr:universal stress protein [Alphaproteobacteria bacterium]